MSEHIIAFSIYSVFGAVLEHINYYTSRLISDDAPKKTLGNPIITGFPLYGIGAYTIISVNKLLGNVNIIIKFIIFSLLLTIIEFFTGLLVGAGKTKNNVVDAWDYSDRKYNYKGIISLYHFIMWGILGIILIEIHPILIKKINCAIEKC